MRRWLRRPLRPLVLFLLTVLWVSLVVPTPISRAAPDWPRYPVRSEVIKAKDGYTYRDRFEKKLANRHTVAEVSDVYFDSYRSPDVADQLQGCHVLLQVSTEAQIDSQDGGGWLKYAEVADLVFVPEGNAWRFQLLTSMDTMAASTAWIKAGYRQVPGCYKDDNEPPPPPTVPSPTAPATVGIDYRLGYDEPINFAEDPLAAMALLFGFTTSTDAQIIGVRLESQHIASPEVAARAQFLGRDWLFYRQHDSPDFEHPEEQYDPAGRVSFAFQQALMDALRDVPLPVDVAFAFTVTLADGQQVPVETTVRIEAIYSLTVMQAGDKRPETPDGLPTVGTRTIAEHQAVKVMGNDPIRLPSGSVLLLRFLDGTAGLIAYRTPDTPFVELYAGYSARNYPGAGSSLAVKVGLDRVQDKGKDFVLKLLLKRASGPIGMAIDIIGYLQGPDESPLTQVRLRSTVGIAITGDSLVSVQTFEGEPALMLPDGTSVPIPPDTAVQVEPGGAVTPIPPFAANATAWIMTPPTTLPTSTTPAGCSDWTGTWDTGDWGMLNFTQAGNAVRGSYTYWGRDGLMEGTVDPAAPRVLTGRWSETNRAPGEGSGRFQFTMSADCATFTGIWGYGDGPLNRSDYFGRRVSTTVPAPTAPVQPTPTPPTPLPPVATPVGPPTFNAIRFGTNYTNHQLVGETSVFPAGTKQVFAAFTYSGMRDGMSWGRLWLVNGAPHVDKRQGQVWDGGTFGTYAAGINNDGGLPSGTWELVLYLDGREVQRAGFVIGGPTTAAPTPVPPPPAGPAGACTWAGTWRTNWGVMTLTQVGNVVTGNYEHDQGRFTGTVNGNVLIGTWSEAPSYAPPGDAGDAELTLAADCRSFTGRWRYGSTGGWATDWTGSR